jgi:acyl dehydratase
MIDYDKTRAWCSGDVRHPYTTRDTILYALGVGAGQDPLDPAALRLTYEKDLVALPTMAAVLASPGFWMRERRELGIDFLRLVHGEQAVTMHRTLPVVATLVGSSRVTRIVDKGEGKGAVMTVEKRLTDEASGELVAVSEQTLFLRGDGGFSRHGGGDEPGPPPPAMPETAPEVTIDLPTRPEAALIYRLSGDINPLHVDPEVAAKAGFPKPILHGLATYGVACRGVVAAFCADDPRRLRAFRARLTSPVYPGETLRLEAWRFGAGDVAFRCRAVERDVVVLANGSATLA